jgi:2-oxoisovalerate/pyruvate ferredoxin oxidoreductase gamma subunit
MCGEDVLQEVRIHGRGGQGAVTTGQIMAISAFYDGKQSQTFPMFGVERAGAPVTAFCRIDTKPINLRCEVYEPNVVIVLDSSLLTAVDVTAGLQKGGAIIVNTNKPIEEVKTLIGHQEGHYDVHIVDATSIALRIFQKPIVNTPMLGAFSKITKLVSLRSLRKGVDEIFEGTKGKEISMLNKKAIEEVFKATK